MSKAAVLWAALAAVIAMLSCAPEKTPNPETSTAAINATSGRQDAASATAKAASEAMAGDETGSANPSRSNVVYCGGETTQAVVDAYFANLSRGLEEGREPRWFNRFLSDQFVVRRDGKRARFNREDFVSLTPRFFSMDDWRQIASRGAHGLSDVGWRGCMLDHGKIWFQATEEKGMWISSINHDMPWEPLD